MPYYGGTPIEADPQMLMRQLQSRGYSRMQAAAIVGNMQRESGLKSNNVNKDEGAYGLLQWRGPRFQALQTYAAQQGKAWTDPAVQADFMHQEMRGSEAKNMGGFQRAQTIDEATAALKPMIRYGDNSLPQRQAFARDLYGASQTPDGDAPKEAAAPPAAQPGSAPPASSASYDPRLLAYARSYDLNPVRPANAQRPLRYGAAMLGEGLGARYNPGGGLAGVQGMLASGANKLGDLLGLQGGQNQGVVSPPEQVPGELAQPTNLNSSPDAGKDPALAENYPPLPRPRPVGAPGSSERYLDDRLMGATSLAELGGVVDPMRYDYG